MGTKSMENFIAARADSGAPTTWLNPFNALVLLLVAAILAYFPTFHVLHHEWTNINIRTGLHGYLIAVVCCWLLWDRREALREVRWAPTALGLPLVIGLAVAWLIFLRANLEALHIFLIPPIILAAVWAALGMRAAMIVAVPIGFLYFGTPVLEAVNWVFQSLTISVTALMLRITSVPSLVDGSLIHLPDGTFEIEPACSGLHYVTVGLAIAVLHGELVKSGLWARVKLAAVMLALSMLANWVRVYVVVYLGYKTKMQHYFIKVDHYWFGWGLFAACVTIFFFLARYLEGKPIEQPATAPASDAQITPRASVVGFIVAGLGLIAVPAIAGVISRNDAATDPVKTFTLPGAGSGWTSSQSVESREWRPRFAGATQTARAEYRDSRGDSVQVFAAIYRVQSQGAELVGHESTFAGVHEQWVSDERVLRVHDLPIREGLLQFHSRTQGVVWWVYDVGSHNIATPLGAQLRYGLEAILEPPLSAVRAYYSSCMPDCDAARHRLESFVGSYDATLQDAIRSYDR